MHYELFLISLQIALQWTLKLCSSCWKDRYDSLCTLVESYVFIGNLESISLSNKMPTTSYFTKLLSFFFLTFQLTKVLFSDYHTIQFNSGACIAKIAHKLNIYSNQLATLIFKFQLKWETIKSCLFWASFIQVAALSLSFHPLR